MLIDRNLQHITQIMCAVPEKKFPFALQVNSLFTCDEFEGEILNPDWFSTHLDRKGLDLVVSSVAIEAIHPAFEPAIETKQVATNGIFLECLVSKMDAPTIIFLHGFPDTPINCYKHQIAHFWGKYQIIAPYLRGYGESSQPESGYDLGTLAADIEGLIESKAHIVGHDWGGAIAWTLAQRSPEKVESLTIINGPHPAIYSKIAYTSAQIFKSWYFLLFQIPCLAEFFLKSCDGIGIRSLIHLWSENQLDADNVVEELTAEGVTEAALKYYRTAFHEKKFSEDIVEASTLIIWGLADRCLSSKNLEGVECYVPDHTLVELEGIGHFPTNEDPENINLLLASFLNQVV